MPTSPDTPLMAMNQGIAEADGPYKAKERADVRRWMKRLDTTLAFDADARRNYVKCRRYARGDSGFLVDANIVGTNIDILEAFLYARNPSVDVTPAKSVEMPSIDTLRESAMFAAEQDPAVQQAAAQVSQRASWNALALGQDPAQASIMAGQQATGLLVEQKAIQNLELMQAKWKRRTRENRDYSETLELTITRLWEDAFLKDRGRPFVRSNLTIGVGVLKASWQQRTAPSPETIEAVNDLTANIARAKSLREEIEDGPLGDEHDVKVADLERQLAAIREKAEEVTTKGFVIDLVPGEYFTVAPGFRIADHCLAPWNIHQIPMELDEIVSSFGLSKEKADKITRYMARKPVMARTDESANTVFSDDVSPLEADAFVKGEAPEAAGQDVPVASEGQGAGCFGIVVEVWDRTTNTVLTTVRGLECWVKPAWIPPPTSRFYPFFLLCSSEVDGQRHPQSPVERTAKLVDEYNRIGSAEAEHRRRTIPKTAFNAGAMSDEQAKKLAKGTTQEMVAIKLTNPQGSIQDVLMPVSYAPIDPALYDRQRINNEIERVWGVQEALGGAVSVAKTATEADIQQQGFQARTGSRRDSLESCFGHLAQYTAEIARYYLTDEDVREIAGPNAFWPPYQGAADLRRLVNVNIRAGSSGKPNTTADREAWSMLLPILQAGIQRIGMLRGSTPADMANSEERLLRLTADRAGDRIDLDSLLPPAGNMPPPLDPNNPAAGVAPPVPM